MLPFTTATATEYIVKVHASPGSQCYRVGILATKFHEIRDISTRQIHFVRSSVIFANTHAQKREKRERGRESVGVCVWGVCGCVCVCVCKREREREREKLFGFLKEGSRTSIQNTSTKF